MGTIARTGDYTAGNYAVGSNVSGDLDTIINAFNGNIETVNLADACVTNVKLANDIVDSNKLRSGSNAPIRETHMKWSSASSGVLAWRAGPSYAGSNGGRIVRCQYSAATVPAGTPDVWSTGSLNFSDIAVDGDPVFSDTPIMLGHPVVTSNSTGAPADVPSAIEVTSISNIAITLEYIWHGLSPSASTIQIEFCVAGPASS